MKKLICAVLAVLTVLGAGASAAERVMLPGDKNIEIAAVQSVLKSRGLYSGECSGIYDRETRAAIAAFDPENEDGAITLDTLAALGLYSGKTASKSGIIKKDTPMRLKAYSRGTVLAELAAGTEVAVISSKSGWSLVRLTLLGAEGYVKSSCITTLSADYSTDMTAPGRSLARGEESSDVAALQKRLAQLGYYECAPSGSYGSVTYMAVRAFQINNSIECTGVACIDTLEALFGDSAVPAAYSSADRSEGPSLYTEGEPLQQQLAVYSQLFLGKPYVLGAVGPKAYDCSGFTRAVFAHFGFTLPRTAYYQGYSNTGEKIKKIAQLECGDLVFFNTNPNDSDRCDHAGIYIGEGMFIHASTMEGKIIVSDINKYYWRDIFSWGRRVID